MADAAESGGSPMADHTDGRPDQDATPETDPGAASAALDPADDTDDVLDTKPRAGTVEHSNIVFQHTFFTSIEGAYFRLTEQTEEPVLVLSIGDNNVILPFPGIRREFDIPEDSDDGAMLDMVAEGLHYVNILKPGDPIPKEILTGEASWEVSDRHRQIAYQRLTMQLVTWLTGDEVLLTDPDYLLQIADDPATKAKVKKAFEEAAAQLGEDRGNTDAVVELIEKLAEEFAHIEALRDRYAKVVEIAEKIQKLRKLYGREQSALEIADPVARLITFAVKGFGETFDQVDAQTGEIISVLKNIETQTQYIHDIRNDLFRRLAAWDDMFEKWDSAIVARGENSRELLRLSYRFLAPRYMQVDEWVLLTKGGKKGKDLRNTEVVW